MNRNKLKLTLLLLAAALPVSLATWVFGVREMNGVTATSNRGQLVIPVMDITELDMRDEQGQPMFVTFEESVADIALEDYEPRPWMLIYLGNENCDKNCDERLYYLRQLHRRLSSESDRVERFYINAGQTELDQRTHTMFAEAFPEMKVGKSDSAILMNNLQRTVPENVDPVNSHYIYVADPLGNVMLYFTPENTTEEIFKDIDKLLDQSSVG